MCYLTVSMCPVGGYTTSVEEPPPPAGPHPARPYGVLPASCVHLPQPAAPLLEQVPVCCTVCGGVEVVNSQGDAVHRAGQECTHGE